MVMEVQKGAASTDLPKICKHVLRKADAEGVPMFTRRRVCCSCKADSLALNFKSRHREELPYDSNLL